MTVERVRVGDVLTLQRREVTIEPTDYYRLIGIYSFGKGLFHREPTPGAELGDYRFFAIEPGDLVLSNIQAWEGAIGYATEADRGTIGTHRFLSYVPAGDRIDTDWARWFFLSEPGMTLIRQAAPGSTMRNRTLAIERFEALEIPLPDVGEQVQVAARLNLIANSRLRIQVTSQYSGVSLEALLASWLETQFARAIPNRTLAEVAEIVRGRGPRYQPDSAFFAINQACVRWNGVDLAQAREVDGAWFHEVPPAGLTQAGDVLVNSTGEGTIGRAATVGPAEQGLPFDSHVLAVRCDTASVLPGYLVALLRSPTGQAQITEAKGANTTKQTELGKLKLERFTIPVPSVAAQAELIEALQLMLDKIESAKAVVDQRSRLLSAVLPAALNEAFAGLS